MAKVKGTNRRTRPKSGYKKQGNKKGRGVKEKIPRINSLFTQFFYHNRQLFLNL